MRFLKLFIVGWVASWIAGETMQLVESPLANHIHNFLGAIIPAAFATVPVWLYIYKYPSTEFEIISKPTFSVLVIAGLLGLGGEYGSLTDQGLEHNGASLRAMLSWSGVVFMFGIVGVIFAKSYPAKAELETDAEN